MGSGMTLETLPHYSMYRFAYWNDVSGTFSQHWFVNHVVSAPGSGVGGVRWYEFRAPAGAATLSNVSYYQSGTFAPLDGNYRWMGSIARDTSGDIALGYSESGNMIFPSIYLTGRIPSDQMGTMEQEIKLQAGGAQITSVVPKTGAITLAWLSTLQMAAPFGMQTSITTQTRCGTRN